MREVSAEEVRDTLIMATSKTGEMRRMAKTLGIHETFICNVRSGKQAASPKIAKALGFLVGRRRMPGERGMGKPTFWREGE